MDYNSSDGLNEPIDYEELAETLQEIEDKAIEDKE
jgi:hypothetical protein